MGFNTKTFESSTLQSKPMERNEDGCRNILLFISKTTLFAFAISLYPISSICDVCRWSFNPESFHFFISLNFLGAIMYVRIYMYLTFVYPLNCWILLLLQYVIPEHFSAIYIWICRKGRTHFYINMYINFECLA
jgi:hypothetical protein